MNILNIKNNSQVEIKAVWFQDSNWIQLRVPASFIFSYLEIMAD